MVAGYLERNYLAGGCDLVGNILLSTALIGVDFALEQFEGGSRPIDVGDELLDQRRQVALVGGIGVDQIVYRCVRSSRRQSECSD